MSDIKERIFLFIAEKNISKSEFERNSGLSNGYLNNFKGNLGSTKLEGILSFYTDLNRDWLLTGEGSMLREEEAPKRMPPKNEVEILGTPEEYYIQVPFLDMGIQAGWNIDFRSPEPKNEEEVDFRLVSREAKGGTYIVAAVSGDSMDDNTKRSISDGDEVLLRLVDDFRWNGLAIRNNLYVIVTQDATVLKQITEVNLDESYITCHSFNEEFADYRIDLADVRWFFKVCRVVNRRVLI